MHKRGLCRHAVSVCLSLSWIMSKRINICSKFFTIGYSHTILVFPHQTGWRYSDGNPPNGGVECSWGRQKTRFWTNIWLRCIHVCSVVNRTSCELWKTKPRRTAESVEHTAASIVRCSHKTTTKCLWRARRYTPESGEVNLPPDTTPLAMTPFSAAVGHSRTESGGYFCCLMSASIWYYGFRTSLVTWEPYPTHEAGSWPQPTHERQQTRGLCPRGVCPGVLVGHRRRQ